MRELSFAEVVVGGAAVLVVVLMIWAAASGPGGEKAAARRALEAQGFVDAVLDDGSAFAQFHGCDKNDGVAYEVDATNPRGARVHVVVCCGVLLKGCTVRSR